jgi:transposase
MDASHIIPLMFPLPEGLLIEDLSIADALLIVRVFSTSLLACCPHCAQPSSRIHGRYVRTVSDLPCVGRRVVLKLPVRKFLCLTAACPHKIFTERLPDLVPSYARITNRLREALVALGLATSAEVSERLAPSLGMMISAPTLLRRLHVVVCPPPPSVRILGIDDWAWKKGQTYGTLLVDLELRRPIELLPDRKEETVEAWLRTHPEIEVISRDRGGEYAAAARKGAPQAQQVADKFHLLKNLRENIRDLMARKQKWLPEVEEATADGIPLRARGKALQSTAGQERLQAAEEREKPFRQMSASPRHLPAKSASSSLAETRSQISRANRSARYDAVRALHQQAISAREIARRLHMSRQTVQRFLVVESFPERSRRAYRGSILDPYKPYILDRWKAGCWNGSQLYAEVKGLGYTGSEALFRLFISSLRKQHQAAGTSTVLSLDADGAKVSGPVDPASKPCIKGRMSPARASWLYIRQSSKLDEKQCLQVAQIRAAHPDLDTAYQLTQTFVAMLAEHQDTALDEWLAQAEHSGLRELKSFAQGIRRDYAAVRATFTSEWSNGPVEAQVNCLKLQKRLMFGRANFDLLRLHVLRRA